MKMKNSNHRISEQIVTFGSNGIKLKGQVFFPASASPEEQVPGLVLCHGFGSSSRQMKPGAKMLAKLGIATLIFDMRGHCTSGGVVDGKMPEDVIDAWNLLKDYPEIDRTRMGLAGHSLGAMSVIMAAEKLDPKVLVALSCPPQMDRVMLFEIPQDFGRWGSQHHHIIEYPRQGAYPWLTGMAAWICRAWMYFFDYTVKVDFRKFGEAALKMKMIDVLRKLDMCTKLFVFCEGDTVTPYDKTAVVYQAAAEPKSLIISKGGFHTTPILRGALRTQWTNWIAEALTR